MLAVMLLKMLSDLGFYMTFTGFFASFFGGSSVFLIIFVFAVSLMYACSYLLRKRGALRFSPYIIAALAFLPQNIPLADYIVCAPALIYALYMTYTGIYGADWDREVQIFKFFWKAFIALIFVCVLTSKMSVFTDTCVPLGLVTFASLVMLTRSLRHEPEIYSSTKYQLLNVGLVSASCLAAWLLGSRTVVNAFFGVLRAIYTNVIAPVVLLLIYGLIYIIQGVMWLFSFIKLRERETDPIKMDLRGAAEIMGVEEEFEYTESELFKKVIIALGIIAALVIIFLIFRYLSRRVGARPISRTATDERVIISDDNKAEAGEASVGDIRKVREVYKKFLRLCQRNGVDRKKSDTSRDINLKSSALYSPEETAELRDIYIEARYNSTATSRSAARAKELYSKLKKET